MITYYTGLIGAGKTLNMVKDAMQDPQYKGRPVYYYGIKECKVPGWTELTREQLDDWMNLPSASVILIDEVQKVWRVRNKNSEVPIYITELEESRHDGKDFLATSQFPRQTDTQFRGHVGRHYHFERSFGFMMLRKFEFQKCVPDAVDNYFERKDAITTTVKLDKKIFGLYKSAEVHTHIKRTPKKLYFVIASFVIFAGLVIMLPSILFTKPEVSAVHQDAVESYVGEFKEGLKTSKKQANNAQADYGVLSSKETFLRALTPIISNRPDTAPLYNALHEPVTKPRANCLSAWVDDKLECACYSQQATKLAIDHNICVYYVNNGYEFDYTIPDYEESQAAQGEGEQPPRADQIKIIQSQGTPRYPNAKNSYAGIR